VTAVGGGRHGAGLPLLVLVGFPPLYFANAASPWSRRFFVEGDASALVLVFGGIAALHWLTAFVAWRVLRADGLSLREAGLTPRPRADLASVVIFLSAAAAVIALRAAAGPTEPLWQTPPANLQLQTLAQRLFWVFLSASAAFCEEFVYRGVGIALLRRRGFRTVSCVALTTLSWTFIHGFGALAFFPGYLLVGSLFAALYLWRGRLAPVMLVHGLVDLGVIGN
jgi:membrane protease YdiL (CAAX protease family)